MGVKIGAFYLMSIASSLFAANQIAPIALPPGSASAITSEQMVNRPAKRDRLPIGQMAPQTDKVPTILDKKVWTECNPPVEIPGRCFA
jgi:hypothetical protein